MGNLGRQGELLKSFNPPFCLPELGVGGKDERYWVRAVITHQFPGKLDTEKDCK